MTIEWLAGNRIRGTSTERTTTSGFNHIPAVSGGWKQVGKFTLGGSANQIDVSSIPDKQYYMVLTHIKDSGQANVRYRFGSSGTIDPNGNYAFKRWDNGTLSTSHTTSSLLMTGDQADDDKFHVTYIANLSGKAKLTEHFYAERGDNLSASYVPRASKGIGKWTETDPLDTLRVYDSVGTGSYNSGSEVVVLGWDPDDTHTDNFWQELANVNLSGGANSNLSSGTISAKKYLWVQYYAQTSASADIKFTFNNSNSGYSDMRQINDSAYSGKISQDNWEDEGGLASNRGIFVNMFIINNADSVKLGIVNSVRDMGSSGTEPQTRHWVGKWTETTNQITEIDLTASTGNLQSVSELRVWGADPV